MKKRLLFSHAAILLLMACCSQSAKDPTSSLPKSERIDAILAQYAERNEFAGAALISEGNEILVKKGYGLANQDKNIRNTPTTRFSMGSVSKLFTFAAVLLEQERGALNIEDTLAEYIPDYPQGDRIKIFHLMFHMSGIVDVANDLPWDPYEWLEPITIENLIEKFKNHPLEFDPGSRVEYSNSGYVLLAYIVEVSSGQSFKTYVEQNLFTPAGMKHSSAGGDRALPSQAIGYGRYEENEPYPEVDPSYFIGSGNLFTTVEDLLLWYKVDYPAKTMNTFAHSAAYGRGYGYRAASVPIPSMDIVIILLSNYINAPMEAMVAEISTVLLADKTIELEAGDIDDYVGRYHAQVFGLVEHDTTVRREKNRLFMAVKSGFLQETRESELYPISSSRFLSKLDDNYEGVILTFHKDENGRAVRMTTDVHGFKFESVRME